MCRGELPLAHQPRQAGERELAPTHWETPAKHAHRNSQHAERAGDHLQGAPAISPIGQETRH